MTKKMDIKSLAPITCNISQAFISLIPNMHAKFHYANCVPPGFISDMKKIHANIHHAIMESPLKTQNKCPRYIFQS